MDLVEIVGKIKDIPVLPVVAHQVNVASAKEEVTAHDLGKIIEKDPALAGKLLKLANSSYYGLVKKVATIERAVTLLGFITVKNFATSVSISGVFKNKKRKDAFDTKGLWLHSLGCAVATETLVSRLKPGLGGEAFLYGILHDIGCSLLVENFSDYMEQVACLIELRSISQSEAEMEILGATHGEVGSYLAEKWNFPERCRRVIEFHHNPPFSTLDVNDPDDLMLLAVYAGNVLVKSLEFGESFDSSLKEVDRQALDLLSVSEEDLPDISELILKKCEEVKKAFE